jgi:hypothetical protein
MRIVVSVGLLCLIVVTAHAVPLRIVEVSAPDIYCEFDSDCQITPTNFPGRFVVPGTTGTAVLWSRLFPVGEPKTPAEGLYAYLYQFDLRKLVGATFSACIKALSIDFGPVVPRDYNGDRRLDHVFVMTKNSPGTIAPAAAEQVNDTITFYFRQPVCPAFPEKAGDRTFFFGLASPNPSTVVTAQAWDTQGANLTLDAQAPSPVDVDCTTASLREALQEARPGETIRFTGLCKETIEIPTDQLTLIGVGKAEITGSGGDQPVLTIAGRRQVVIKNVMVRQGYDGVLVQRSTGVLLERVKALGNADDGFQIDEESTIQLNSCTARRNGRNGFFVRNGSLAMFQGETLSEYNKGQGLWLDKAKGGILGASQTGYGKRGVAPESGQGLEDAPWSAAMADSAFAAPASATPCTTLVRKNLLNGVVISATSPFFIPGCKLTTRDNTRNGVLVRTGGSFAVFAGQEALSRANGHHGIRLESASSVYTAGLSNLRVNSRHGLQVTGASTVVVDGGSGLVCSKQNIMRGVVITPDSGVECNGGADLFSTANGWEDVTPGATLDGACTVALRLSTCP